MSKKFFCPGEFYPFYTSPEDSARGIVSGKIMSGGLCRGIMTSGILSVSHLSGGLSEIHMYVFSVVCSFIL